MKGFLLSILLTFNSLLFSNFQVDVLADWDLTDIPINWEVEKNIFGINPISNARMHYNAFEKNNILNKKIIFMNPPCTSGASHNTYGQGMKPIVFIWEPTGLDPSLFRFFSRIYTYNDSIVDGKKIHKFYYPYRRNMIDNIIPFSEKKFCVMVSRHWIPERCEIVRFFNRKLPGEFEFFGSDAGGFANNPMYKGRIPGYHSGDEKIHMLSQYKFCICFENTHHLPGYITEKIFACFAAGCIPIYFGAPNITEYVSENCFIDYRKFKNHEALYKFLKGMTSSTYEAYLENIQNYLKSKKAQLFSTEKFVEILHEAAESF